MGCIWWYDLQNLALIWIFFGGPPAVVSFFANRQTTSQVLIIYPFISFFMAVPLLLALGEAKWCFLPTPWFPIAFAISWFVFPWVVFVTRS